MPKGFPKILLLVLLLFLITLTSEITFPSLALAQPSFIRNKIETEKIIPEFEFIYPAQGAKLRENVKIKGKVENALSVEFYLRLPQAITLIYLGNGILVEKDFWEYSFDTTLTPNGTYKFFAKVINPQGEYFSKEIDIIIKNELKRKPEEEKLKEEIEKAKTEIQKAKEKIIEKEEETKKEIEDLIESSIKEGKKTIKEKTEDIENELIKKEKESKEKAKEKIRELIKEIGKEEALKKEIGDIEKLKEEIGEKMAETKKEIKEIQEIKEKIKETRLESKEKETEILEEIKREKLESQKEEKEKIEEKVSSLIEEHEKTKEKVKEIKKEILEKIVEPVEKIEKITKKEEKEEISKIKKDLENKVESRLENLENKILEIEEIKSEKEEILVKDSDKDQIPDEEEIKLGTDPLNPDSDNDGFLDGTEYLSGFNPLKPSPADKIIYGDPRKIKPKQADIYKVERAESIQLPTGKMGIKLEGKGLPNSFVTIYIYSYAIVMTTKTDGNGNWSVILDKPLADGRHQVYVTVTNNHGEITARSEAFMFLKSGEKVAAITIPAIPTEKIISPADLLQKSFFVLILAIIILFLGIALIIIGILTKKKAKEEMKNK